MAWLSLDAADNDPARFWRHVVAALDRARPGIAERVGSLLGPPVPPSFEGLVTALVNELAARPGEDEVLLVVDDYHLIEAQPVHASLEFLVEHLPRGLDLVVASRADPPLPLPRLRVGGRLAELRAADLRFTAEEAAALLREATGGELPGEAVGRWRHGPRGGPRASAGGPFTARAGGSRRFCGGLQRESPLRAGLFDRGGTRASSDQLRGFLLETSCWTDFRGFV